MSLLQRGKRNISIDNIEKIAVTLKADAYLLFIGRNRHHFPKTGDEDDCCALSKGGISDEPGNNGAKTGRSSNKL